MEKEKIKLKDRRVHLSDKLLKADTTKSSMGDDTVIGLRAHFWDGGSIAFYYHYIDKLNPKKRYKEKIGTFPSVNVVQARNRAKVIAVMVMEGKSQSQIKRVMRTEPTVSELYAEYEKLRLKAPRYKPSSIKKWLTNRRVWIDKKTQDPIIKGMFLKAKMGIGDLKLSEINMDNLKELHGFIGSKTTNNANSIVQQLSVIFGYAIEKKYIDVNPVKFKKDDFFEQKENNKYLSRPQMEMVLGMALRYDERSKENPKLNTDYYKSERLNPVSCCIIAKALMSPQRYRSEGGMIRWKQISFPQKKLFLDDTKVGQRAYQIGPRVMKMLKAISNEKFKNVLETGRCRFWYPDDIRREYVFPSYNFGKINNVGKVNDKPYVHSVSGTWRTILSRLNLDYLPMYNCRHSYLTDGLSKTKNLKMIKELAGHKKISTTERYARVLGEDVTDAIELIDSQEVKAPIPKVVNFKK